ncbi:MAG: hypothetical protein RSE56_02160 [Bacilli bacterium]
MSNNKIKTAFAGFACLLALSSCSEVIAKPNGYKENILDIKEEIVNNMESVIYDGLHSKDAFTSGATKLVFEKIFISYFGTFDEINEAATKKGEKLTKLITDHKVYQEFNKEGNRDTSATAKTLEEARVMRTYNEIQKEIASTLFSTLNASTFKEDNTFKEQLFALSIYKKLYTLDANKKFDELSFYEKIITPTDKIYDEKTNTWTSNKIIHLDYYNDYIRKELVPAIMQTILVENYLYKKEYASFGRKYARKVNYVAIPENAKFPGSAKTLCDAFIKNNLKNPNATEADRDLNILGEAWKGHPDMSDLAKELLKTSGLMSRNKKANEFEALQEDQKTEFGEVTYYEGTEFGDVVIDFEKIKTNIATTDATAEATFSGSGKYSYNHGFTLKKQEISLKDHTVDGWGTKTDGFSSLPGEARNRLFNISVSTDVNTSAKEVKASTWVKNINDHYYLLPKSYEQGNENAFLLYDANTYYIVEVEEAASTSRLSKDAEVTTSYTNIRKDGGLYAEDVAYKIAGTLAGNATNKTNALEYYLEESKILYHDESIYNYFKKTYPDLFVKK